VISPFSAIMAAAGYFISKYTVRIVSISSIILSFILLIAVILLKQPLAYVLAAVAACFLILVNHKSNITRLLKGQEPKI
jgi:glycerol-3-phosphate acyltransferase PlsY